MNTVKENKMQHKECDIDYAIEEDKGKYYVQMWVTVNRQEKSQQTKLGFNHEFASLEEAESAAIESAKDFVDKNLSV